MDLSYNYTAIIFHKLQNPVQVPGFSLSREKVGGALSLMALHSL